MNACEEFLKYLDDKLPDLCRNDDLVEIGLFNHRQNIDQFRYQHKGPPFFKIGKRIFYPKLGILQWLKDNSHEGYQKMHTSPRINDRTKV